MSDLPPTPAPGAVTWFDLTVPDAATVRDFYAAVAGWAAQEVDMGGYADYAMVPPGGGGPVAGICWQRGPNAGIPPQWLPYISVADLDASVAACRDRGGEVLVGPKNAGPTMRYCVIRDPAGATCAIIESR